MNNKRAEKSQKAEKKENKFITAVKSALYKYNIGLVILAVITAIAFAISRG